MDLGRVDRAATAWAIIEAGGASSQLEGLGVQIVLSRRCPGGDPHIGFEAVERVSPLVHSSSPSRPGGRWAIRRFGGALVR